MEPDRRFVEEVRGDQPAARGTRVERTCGACTACCTVLGVLELEKPPYARCHHLAACGCAIYELRPAACRSWSCDWLLGGEPGGDERNRPDALGIMFTSEQVAGHGPLRLAYEVWPGAADGPMARSLINQVARAGPVAVLSNRGPTGQEAEFVVASQSEEATIPRLIELFQRSRVETMNRVGGQLDPHYRQGGASA